MCLNCFAFVIPLTKEELILKSQEVIHGVVTEVRCAWSEDHSMIYTFNKLEVLDVFMGEPRDEVIIRTFGGSVGDTGQWFSDQPELTEGMEVIIHVFMYDNGDFGIRGLEKGVYYVNDGVLSNSLGKLDMTLDQFGNFVDEVKQQKEEE